MPLDLTIVFLTINNVPQGWAARQRRRLLAAARGAPIITISKDPLDWGQPTVRHERQEVPEGSWARTVNVHRQILRGAKLAETPYVAVAEDDCLYPPAHFWTHRPPLDAAAYNFSRWCMFSWERARPYYYHSPVDANSAMIAPRDWLIAQLDAPEITRAVWRRLVQSRVIYWTTDPVLTFYHDQGNDPLERSHRKRPTPVRAYDIPYWGRVEEAMGWWWR